MKTKIILLMLIVQVALMAKITAQAVGITSSTTTATTFPASTLDVQGSLGINLATNPTNALLAGAVVLFNSSSTASLVLPTINTITTYINRIYILANRTATNWAIAQTTPIDLNASQTFYYNLLNVKTTLVLPNSSVIIISDGSNWLQIK